MKKLLLAMVIGVTSNCLMAQPQQAMDFSWAAITSSTSHLGTFTICEGETVGMTLTTSSASRVNVNAQGNPISNGHPVSSVLVPSPTVGTPLTVTTTITFSAPVANLQLLLRDLDDDVPPVGPEETFSNFRINGQAVMPSSITPLTGSYAQLVNTVNPLAANCNGWFRFATTNITSISFDYWRINHNYAFLLDSLKIHCNSTYVGMDPRSLANSIALAPNPAGSYVDVLGTPGLGATWTATLHDMNGHTVLQGKVSDQQTRLPLEQLSNGAYLLELSRGQQRLVKKLIVMHDSQRI
jgi:Secretion system C-terminal sorting domain